MVKLEKSQKEFLMLLLENENPQSIQSIQDQLDISRRTVYYIVNKINEEKTTFFILITTLLILFILSQ